MSDEVKRFRYTHQVDAHGCSWTMCNEDSSGPWVKWEDYESLARRAVEAEKERDLAIAHDRQPYPTAEAYEQVCEVLDARTKFAVQQRDRADAAESRVRELETQTEKWQAESLVFANENVALSNRVRELEAELKLCREQIAGRETVMSKNPK